MSTTTVSSALRAQIRGTVSTDDLTDTQRAALRSWARRQARAKAQGIKGIKSPTGNAIWL
jgi:hypothetical protein